MPHQAYIRLVFFVTYQWCSVQVWYLIPDLYLRTYLEVCSIQIKKIKSDIYNMLIDYEIILYNFVM